MAREPDLKTDRFFICAGGAIPMVAREYVLDRPYDRITSVLRQLPLDTPEGVLQNSPRFRMRPEVYCGTVDEIADRFRADLETSARSLFGLDVSRSRWLWEANARFQAFLRDRGVDGLAVGPDARFVADDSDPRVRAARDRLDAAHDHPTLSRAECELFEDLLSLGLGQHYTARGLADRLTAYADWKEARSK